MPRLMPAILAMAATVLASNILVQFLVSSVLLAYLPEKHRHAEEDDDETAEAAAA